MYAPRAFCTAQHPTFGACTRQELMHERHASPAGSWFLPTAETLVQRIARMAAAPLPEVVDSKLNAYYEGYRDALVDAVAIAAVQPPVDMAGPWLLLGQMIAPCSAKVIVVPQEAEDVARLLPGAAVAAELDRALYGRGVEVATDGRLEVGGVVVEATHRRPARVEEVVDLMDRRHK